MLLQRIPTFLLIAAIFYFIFGISDIYAQHNNSLKASLESETKEIDIQQEFEYVNDSQDTLRVLYFNDWNNAYSMKSTALAKRFDEEFKKSLHLAKDKDRGKTIIFSIVDGEYRAIIWNRTSSEDIIKIELNSPLAPNASTKLFITYTVKLPPNKYTSYGYNIEGGYYLNDWYLTPAVYDGKWQLYSNKNLDDLYTGNTNTNIIFNYPDSLFIGTNFKEVHITGFPGKQQITLEGVNRKSCYIILNSQNKFTKHVTPEQILVTDLRATKYDEISQGVSINRISRFINDNLGDFPYEQLLVSEVDFNKNPLYGLNQLPSFIRPYDKQFQFEMTFMKTALTSYMRESIFLNPRKEKWVADAVINYMMIKFVEEFYPDQKMLGKLSKWWLIKGFHLAQMDFNEQYSFLYMYTARKNLDQALNTSNDSLIKFNQKIANTYKAGLGLAYLADYTGVDNIDTAIKEFYEQYKLKPVKPSDFVHLLKENSKKDIDWFFKTYVSTDDRIDFKITNVIKTQDSLSVTLKNKTGTDVPISLFGLKNNEVVSEYWFDGIKTKKTFTIPRNLEDKLVLNYDHTIPEFNERDNWKALKGFFISNKKLKFQFFKDAEDPYYNQIFYMPTLGFNIYDGLAPGIRFTNKTLLERPFVFDFSPQWSFKENTLIGSGKFTYRDFHRKSGFYVTSYALRGSSAHFQVNSRYSTITPSISFGWRPEDLISNKRKLLTARVVNVFRNIDPSLIIETDPDYSVLDVRFRNTKNGIIEYFSWFADAQYSSDFTKIAFNLEYRKLFDNNTQFNFRFFAGKFLRNNTTGDYFSFALDRPTDYLFDYNYIARSADTGIWSQQIIIAEGGFKSQFENPFANDWIATTNTSVSIWRWVEAYGDLGFIKNQNQPTRFVYDSGIRLNLITDYFELYFPVYSNNGWEISQSNYAEKIRFIITLSPRTLTGLFTRKWF